MSPLLSIIPLFFQGCTSYYPKYEGDPILHNHEVEQYVKPYYKKGINTFGWTFNLGLSAGVGYYVYQNAPTNPLINIGSEVGVSLSDKDSRLIQGIGSGILLGLLNYTIMKDNTRKEIVTEYEAKQWIADYDNDRKMVEFARGKYLSTIPIDGDKHFVMENVNDARFFAEQYPNSKYADNVITNSLSKIPSNNHAELVRIFPNLDVSAKIKLQLILNSKTIDQWIAHTNEFPEIIAKADSNLVRDKVVQICTNLHLYGRLMESNPTYIKKRELESMAIVYVKTLEEIDTFRSIFPSSMQEKKLEDIALSTINNFSSGIKVKQKFNIQYEHPVLDSVLFYNIRSLSEVQIFQKELPYSSFTVKLPELALKYLYNINHILQYVKMFPQDLLIDQVLQEKETSFTRSEIKIILQEIAYSQRKSFLKKRLVHLSTTFEECIEAVGYAKEFIEELAKKSVQYVATLDDYKRFRKYFGSTQQWSLLEVKYNDMLCKEPENLGENINTSYREYFPKISPDGNTLYFVRKDAHDGFGGEDIYVSYKDDNDEWSEAINIGEPLNNSGNNAVYSISQDGQELFLHNQYSERGNNPSISQMLDEVWSDPVTQFIPDLVSNGTYHNGSLTADGKTLLLSINRYDAIGGNDLYVVQKDEYGNWQAPLNLGPEINTYSEESSVFIAADGETIYFSSKGHSGYGGSDMFMSRRLDNSWTKWTPPLNLGAQINSSSNDEFYVIPAKGDFIYFSSTRKSENRDDIYRMCLPQELRPKPVALITGRVYNRKDNTSIPATVYYEDLETGKVLGSVRTNSQTGEYKIILVVGKKYGYYAIADKFLSQSENMDLLNLVEYKKESQNLTLIPIESGQSITMNNLFFESKQFALKNESFLELNRIVKFMEQNPLVKIEISGHTDDIGSDENNLILSEKRAFEVYMHLVSKDVSKERLIYVGYGESKPKVPNTTDQNRAQNRRVELMIR